MAKFRKERGSSPAIPTASLPDIIFILLFFFMVTTKLRESTLMVRNNLPKVTQIEKLAKKELIMHLYVGEPLDAANFGSEPRIQISDAFVPPTKVRELVTRKKFELEGNADNLQIAMKVDKEVKMGLLIDVKQELREIDARKIAYPAGKDTRGE